MRNLILRHAIPLIRTHGFTRQTLALAALSLPTPHAEPLSETAVEALFGSGDIARKTLIKAWLDEGIRRMGVGEDVNRVQKVRGSVAIREALRARLEWNEPALDHLPEAFALLSIPQTLVPLPILDISFALSHSLRVANEACFLAGDASIGPSWYGQRASIALVYAAAELHQLTSPTTAIQFLDGLLASSDRTRAALTDAGQFAEYLWRSWAGIIKSKGIL